MTEELTPEFLKFSEMLDAEDHGESVQGEDAKILLELREALQNPSPEDGLGADFAQETAAAVLTRYESLNPLAKLGDQMGSHLLGSVLEIKQLWKVAGLSGLGIGIGLVNPNLLYAYAGTLLTLAIGWSGVELFQSGPSAGRSLLSWKRLTLLLPSLVFLALGTVGGFVSVQAAYSSAAPSQSVALGGIVGLLLCFCLLGPAHRFLHKFIGKNQKPRLSFAVLQICSGVFGLVVLRLFNGILATEFTLLPSVFFDTVVTGELYRFSPMIIGLVLSVAALLSPLERWREPTQSKSVDPRLVRMIFLGLPLAATTTLAFFVGIGIAGLATLSLTFSASAKAVTGMGILVGIGMLILVARSCYPYWIAHLKLAPTAPFRTTCFQVFHGLVTGLLLTPLLDAQGWFRSPKSDWGIYLPTTLLTLIALLVSWFAQANPVKLDSAMTLRKALLKKLSNLALGIVPIFGAMFVFYQLHLTREIHDKSYSDVVNHTETWVAEQKNVKPENNGWLVLRPFLAKSEQDKPENSVITEKLKGPREIYSEEGLAFPDLSANHQQKWPQIRKDFIEELPRIEEALSRPNYSHIATEGFGLNARIPDLNATRAVNQGLNLLFREEIAAGDSKRALEYTILGLQWASKPEAGTLIELMIQLAQLSITQDGLEEAIVRGHFDREQLLELVQALTQAQPGERDFAYSMERESLACSRALLNVSSGEYDLNDLGETGPLGGVLPLLPRSYWESERKAYWNNQLRLRATWYSLIHDGRAFLEINKLNLGSAILIPNAIRANTQFCKLHSNYSALILMCYLEVYKIDHDRYPETLTALAPKYLEQLPVDFMHPSGLGLKPTFQYELAGKGYLLKSESQAYNNLVLNKVQVYGHAPQFGPEKP